jgi:hypothetical protein
MLSRLRRFVFVSLLVVDYSVVGIWALSGVSVALFVAFLPARVAHADERGFCTTACTSWNVWPSRRSCPFGGSALNVSGFACKSTLCSNRWGPWYCLH